MSNRTPIAWRKHQQGQWVTLMASLLAMGLLLGYFLFADHQRITDWDRDRLSLQCRVIGENLESQFGGIYNALIGVRRDLPQLRHDSGWQVVSHRLEALRDAMPAVSSMHITDAFGKILAADRPETIGINLGAREYFGEARDNPDPNIFFVSPPFSRVLKNSVMRSSFGSSPMDSSQ